MSHYFTALLQDVSPQPVPWDLWPVHYSFPVCVMTRVSFYIWLFSWDQFQRLFLIQSFFFSKHYKPEMHWVSICFSRKWNDLFFLMLILAFHCTQSFDKNHKNVIEVQHNLFPYHDKNKCISGFYTRISRCFVVCTNSVQVWFNVLLRILLPQTAI